MKTLSIEDAKGRFDAVCKEALAGEIIRLRTPEGLLLELTLVPAAQTTLSGEQLAQCYGDSDWAEFENLCGAASH